MNKKNNKKGFTLAELLIVVAIIAVLVAIAIPIFTTQLEKSRESTDLSNVRSAAAEVVTEYLTEPDSSHTMSVTPQQRVANWQNKSSVANQTIVVQKDGSEQSINVPAKTSSAYVVTVTASGEISVN